MSDMTQDAILDLIEVKARMILKEDINLDERVINIRGSITSKTAERFNKSISFLESVHDSAITVMVNSPGGDIYSAFAIIDRIQNSRCTITTIATGLVASAGIPILASGNIRKATKNVSLMYHEPSFNLPFERLTTAELETKHVKELGRRMNTFMSENSKKNYSFWSALGKHIDYYFDAEKALEFGLIEEIYQGGV